MNKNLKELNERVGAARESFSRLTARGVPNYFGEQRFGRERANADLGKALLMGQRLPKRPGCLAYANWTLGEGFEGRNATHQIKKMTHRQLVDLRARLHLDDEIPDDMLVEGENHRG